jgi:putative oxidoreductase
VGGFGLIIGAFVVVVSVPLMVSMFTAMITVHLRYGFSATKTIGLTTTGPVFGPPGYEIYLLYIGGLFVLVLAGAGPLSVDQWLRRRKGITKS